MSTKSATVEFLLDQMSSAGNTRARPMFGEYGVYCDDKIIALICDDQLFVKITPASRVFLDEGHDAPPYPGAKNYLLVPGDRCEDAEWLGDLIRQTADSLLVPKPKKK